MACVALASIAVGLRGTTFAWFPGHSQAPAGRAVTPIDSFIAIHRPAGGKLTLLSNRPKGWTTIAWATRDGQVCWATYPTAPGGVTDQNCWQPTDVPGRGGEGPRPACLKPFSHGQHITFGVINVKPGPAFGGPVVVWVACARSPCPGIPS